MSNRRPTPVKQTQTVKKKVVKKGNKRKLDKASLIILVTCIVIGIPSLIVGYELISAQLGTHSPVNGNRFKNDLDPAISKDQLSTIESNVKSIDGVDKVDVELVTSTLRIYLDCEDSASDATIASAVEKAYDQVASTLDMNTYFTIKDDMKMYDLEVHAYNNVDFAEQGDNYIYYILNKSSSMEAPHTQCVSKPLDAELADSLRNPKPEVEEGEGDMTVGGAEDVEAPSDSENEQTQE